MEELKAPAIEVSPCVRLFIESLIAEASSIGANKLPVDFQPEVRDAQTRVWPRLAGQSI
jgi:hypothetical protein